MLRANLKSRTTRTTKYDRNLKLAAGHVEHLRSGVDDLVGGEDRKVEGHELDDRSQPNHRGADTQAGKTQFGDWSIDDTLVAELVPAGPW